MVNIPVHYIETDVLVVGGGGGGIRAAIAASFHAEKITLVSKGPLARSGLTPMVQPGFAACLGTQEGDSPQLHYEDMIKAGYEINHHRCARVVAENAPKEIRYFEKLGVRFDRLDDGKIRQYPQPGHRYPRGCALADNMGRILLNALGSELSRRNVNVLEEVFVMELLQQDNRVFGAIGLDLVSFQLLVFLSRVTIVATGGNTGMFSFHTGSPDNTGDGQALAFRAGAELADMEFIQFNPNAIVHPLNARGVLIPANAALMYMGVVFLNNKDEPFLAKYDPVLKEKTTRDIKCRAMFNEISLGRGTKNNGVYLDCSNLAPYQGIDPMEVIIKRGGQLSKYLKSFGVDILTQKVEVAPAAHFTLGGIRINEKGETSINNLYAVGEVAAGAHGANRLAGNALAEIFSFGAVAGKEAGLNASQAAGKRNREDKGQIEQVREHLNDCFKEDDEEEKTALQMKSAVGEIMFNYFGPSRNSKGLCQGLEEIQSLKGSRNRIRPRSKDTRYNMDLVECFEIFNILDIAEICFVASLERKESRGCFYRDDFQDTKAEFKKNIIVNLENSSIQTKHCPVVKEGDKTW